MIQEISIAKDAIRDAKELRRFHNLPVDKGLTAAYQILATPPTDHPDVQKLIAKYAILDGMYVEQGKEIVVLQANHDRLQERDCNASIELCYNDGNDPFARESLTVVDVGVSDNAYVVESKVLSNLQASHTNLMEANEIYSDCLMDTMKRLLKSKCPHALAAIMWIEQALDEAKQALAEAEKIQ